MDKQAKDFFEDILNDGGTPEYSGSPPKAQKEILPAAFLRSIGSGIARLFKKKPRAEKAKEAPKPPEAPKAPEQPTPAAPVEKPTPPPAPPQAPPQPKVVPPPQPPQEPGV